MVVTFPRSFRKTPQTFHELRETLQHIETFIAAGGAGGMRWTMNPVLPPGVSYKAAYNECVRCNPGDEQNGGNIDVLLPQITEEGRGLMVAIKSVFDSTQTITAIPGAGDEIGDKTFYLVNDPEGLPPRNDASIIIVADNLLKKWEILGEWKEN